MACRVRVVRTFVLVLAVAGLCLGVGAEPAAAQPARTAASDVYTVVDVPVDVTAETAADARDRALLLGQREAFRRLLRRLALDADELRVRVDDGTLATVVRAIEVGNERASTVRYLANLTVHFNQAAVRDYFETLGLAFADTRPRPVLVLPVYRVGRVTSLFDDPNPWRQAWVRHVPQDTLVPFALPLGDLADLGQISGEQALAGDLRRLDALVRRYGAGEVLVAGAGLNFDADTGLPSVDLTLQKFGGSDETVIVDRLVGSERDQVAALLAQAVARVTSEIEAAWKRDSAIRDGQGDSALAVSVAIESLDEFVEIRRRLSGIGLIVKVEVAELSRREARLKLRYRGEPQQLKTALANRDLDLDEAATEWQLRLVVDAGSNRGRVRP
jgi:hypothetical protein